MAKIAFGLGLATIWVLAWGSATPANVLGGIVVAWALLTVLPDAWSTSGRARVRIGPLLSLAGYVVRQAVVANVAVTRQVLAPRPDLAPAVVAVPLPDCSDGALTVITHVMALMPGTMPVELDHDPTVLHVHALRVGDPDDVRAEVLDLAGRVRRAFGERTTDAVDGGAS